MTHILLVLRNACENSADKSEALYSRDVKLVSVRSGAISGKFHLKGAGPM